MGRVVRGRKRIALHEAFGMGLLCQNARDLRPDDPAISRTDGNTNLPPRSEDFSVISTSRATDSGSHLAPPLYRYSEPQRRYYAYSYLTTIYGRYPRVLA